MVKTNLPNYVNLVEGQKDQLISYCLSKENLRKFLPESTNLKSIDRQFFLDVSLVFTFSSCYM